MILLPILAVILGFLFGIMVKQQLPPALFSYVAISIIAGIDTFMGGLRSAMEGKFQTDVFLTGLFANILLACGFAWIGERLGINLFLVVAFVFGWRIFNNLGVLRRILLTSWHESRRRKRLESERSHQGVS